MRDDTARLTPEQVFQQHSSLWHRTHVPKICLTSIVPKSRCG